MLHVCRDMQIWRELANPMVVFFGQLSHSGREMTLNADGTHPVAYAPSAVPNERFYVMPREVYRRDYKRV